MSNTEVKNEEVSQKPIIIGIAGGTGSGKSTFTNRLKDKFGDHVTVLYHDNYYRAQDDLSFEERKKMNYDHPSAFETDLLIEHLRELKNGHAVQCPIYDYSNHNRSNEVTVVKPSRIILLEGILVLADERLRKMMDIRIFVDADADERILRRVQRDVKERGRDIENIIDQYLTTVKPMHYLYVEPTKMYADFVTNSGMNDVALDLVATKIQSLLDGGKVAVRQNTNEEEQYFSEASKSLKY
ncbi:uridine kinase [Lachnospiraceae bacterium KH1T2]|nr:uridine kinase [Lachnospiraceae bacterium KH1T2]